MATIVRGRFRRYRQNRTGATVAARALLSATLALAARGTPSPFRASLAAAHLLPPVVAGPLILALPWLATLAALYLAIGLFLRPVALVTAAALLLATGMLVVRLMMGAPASISGALSVAGSISALPLPIGLADSTERIAVSVAGNVVAIALAAVVYGGDRYTLSVDGFLFGPLPADLLDEEDLPPNLVLLAPPPALYEDEDGASSTAQGVAPRRRGGRFRSPRRPSAHLPICPSAHLFRTTGRACPPAGLHVQDKRADQAGQGVGLRQGQIVARSGYVHQT